MNNNSFTLNLLANEDLLLSSALNDDSKINNNSCNDLTYDSYSLVNGVVSINDHTSIKSNQNASNDHNSTNSNQNETNNAQDLEFVATTGQTILEKQTSRSLSINQINPKEEIIDLNIFDMLNSEDPDMASFLESVNNSDIISYLPQLSINSTSKILGSECTNNSKTSENLNNNQNVLIKLDELIESTAISNNSDSFKEFCDLLALNKSDLEDIKTGSNDKTLISLTPPLTPTTLQPSRTSLRLQTKKSLSFSNSSKNHQQLATQSMIKSSKRKRSFMEDEIDSNDNSFDSDPVYLRKKDDQLSSMYMSSGSIGEDECSNDTDSFNISITNNDDDNSNERDFKEYVKRTRMISIKHKSKSISGDMGLNDPMKKESNKEAATRYRLKKLNEKDQLFETRIHLEKENDHVKKKIELVQTEINYLKMLLVQMLLSQGVDEKELYKI